MTGESYTQRSAERGLNAIAGGDDDAVQTLSHHHTHRSSSSDVNDPSSDAQSGAAGAQCSSSYFASASTAGPSSLVPAAVSSAAAAAVLRSPTIKAPRIVSSEYTSTAPSATEGTAGAAPPTVVDGAAAAAAAAAAHHARHAELTYYNSAEAAHPSTSSAAAMGGTHASGVECDTSATSCAPSFRVNASSVAGLTASGSANSRAKGSPRFQLLPPPVNRRRRAAAASAASSGGESSPNSPSTFAPRESLSACSELYNIKYSEMQDRPSCVAKPQVSTPARLAASEAHRQGRRQEGTDSPTPSSTVSSSTSSSTSSCWYTQATFQGPSQQPYLQASRASVNRRGVRLRRSRSLPNMKTKPTVDIGAEASHRLLVPGRVAPREAPLHSNARVGPQGLQAEEAHRAAASPTQTSYCHQQPPSQQLRGHYLRPYNRMTPSTSHQSQADGEAPTRQSSRGQFQAAAQAGLASKAKQVFTPSLHPPITRQTLKELDLHEILKNPQLRHDVVYDANVQFRPNFDGERGRRKRDFGNKYWLAVQREIETGCTCTSFVGKMVLPCICDPQQLRGRAQGSNAAGSSSTIQPIMAQANARALAATGRPRLPSRLPPLITELRAICLSVLPTSSGGEVPLTPLKAPATPTVASDRKSDGTTAPSTSKEQQSSPTLSTSPPVQTPAAPTTSPALGTMGWGSDHHQMISQTLDPHMLSQQLQHSTPDVAALVTFVGSILKLHCAPMRDELIETMISTVYAGDVTQGLRLCFEVLELMKLDIANHQLRSSRTYLVETAVEFETRWFREQMDGKLSFERTMRWFSDALSKRTQETESLEAALMVPQTKNDVISSAFDEGFLSLVFEPPNAALLATPGRFATNLTLLSNASLNHACTGIYPETFQFDAFRLLAFHGDVSDITIVYMLLLLFRQLSCSSQSLTKHPLPPSSLPAATIQENASALAVSQLDAIKSEIWTLLNDAELELIAATRALCSNPQQCSSHAASPTTPTTPRSPGTPPGIANRILGGSMWPGRSKFESSRWRRAVGDIVLQIASRATRVQLQARQGLSSTDADASNRNVSPDEFMPSDATMSMLVQWLDRNLRPESGLHTLCSSRLRAILAALTTLRRTPATASGSTRTRKHGEDGDEASLDRPSKKIRLQAGKVAPVAVSGTDGVDTQDKPTLPLKCKAVVAEASTPIVDGGAVQSAAPDAAAMERAAGLEPLSGEIRVLADRMLKVKMLHLRVFRPVYERMAAMQVQQQQSGQAQQSEDVTLQTQSSTKTTTTPNVQPSSSSPSI